MKKTVTVQGSKRNLYLNIPTKIVEKMNIEKGETVLIEVIDEDTMQKIDKALEVSLGIGVKGRNQK